MVNADEKIAQLEPNEIVSRKWGFQLFSQPLPTADAWFMFITPVKIVVDRFSLLFMLSGSPAADDEATNDRHSQKNESCVRNGNKNEKIPLAERYLSCAMLLFSLLPSLHIVFYLVPLPLVPRPLPYYQPSHPFAGNFKIWYNFNSFCTLRTSLYFHVVNIMNGQASIVAKLGSIPAALRSTMGRKSWIFPTKLWAIVDEISELYNF